MGPTIDNVHNKPQSSPCPTIPQLPRFPRPLEASLAMELRRWLIPMVLICLFIVSQAREIPQEDYSLIYNHTLARILVEYASAVYVTDLNALITWTCSRCNNMTKGFEMIELIVDTPNCLQAFVGVAHDLNSVVIAFRGSQGSIHNWIEDLYWKQLDLDYPCTPDPMRVHSGFFYAYHTTTLRPRILGAVQRARELYENISIIVTGHSMGGAMASFCALDLVVNCGMPDVQLMTFGQPRIGNAAFASYFSEQIPRTIRLTNGKDMVPHLPPYFTYLPQKTYRHFPREVWLHDISLENLVFKIEQICDGTGEDPTCSRSVTGSSISDHLEYFGVSLHSGTHGSCSFLLDKSIKQYYSEDSGNFIFSRDLAAINPQRSTQMRINSV